MNLKYQSKRRLPREIIGEMLMPIATLTPYPARPWRVMLKSQLKKRIFVVEDQAAVREGIVETLNREDDLTVCGEADDKDTALAAIQETNPDLVLADIQLKSSNGIDLIRELHRQHPFLALVGMTMWDPIGYERQAREAGADTFVVKQEGPGKMVEVIRDALKRLKNNKRI